MPQAYVLRLLGRHGQGRHRRELFGSQADQDFRKQRRELRFEGDAARDALAGVVHLIGQQAGHLLVCAVLKQAREQQVSSFQKGEILLVLDFPAGEQARRLQIQQRRRDHQKTRRFVQIPIRTLGLDIGDELVDYLVQCQFGDLELVFRDQRQQEVEGAFEVPDFQRETARRRGRARIGICKRDRLPGIVRGDRHRARTSLASRRYASAPELLDAKDVIGSPATAASGNFTVR